MHLFLKFNFGIKFYMFRTLPLSTIRSFSLYTQQWSISYRFSESLRAGSEQNLFLPDPVCMLTFHPDSARKLSANLYGIDHCCVYSEKLPMVDRGTVRNM